MNERIDFSCRFGILDFGAAVARESDKYWPGFGQQNPDPYAAISKRLSGGMGLYCPWNRIALDRESTIQKIITVSKKQYL